MRRMSWCVLFFLVLVTRASLAFAECDDDCREAVANQIDAEVAKYSEADRALVAKIKQALGSGDEHQLALATDRMETQDKDAWRFQNPEHRALWYEMVFIALNYASTPVCFASSFWFMLYVQTWEKEGDSGVIDEVKRERFSRAQSYLNARHAHKNYQCTSSP